MAVSCPVYLQVFKEGISAMIDVTGSGILSHGFEMTLTGIGGSDSDRTRNWFGWPCLPTPTGVLSPAEPVIGSP